MDLGTGLMALGATVGAGLVTLGAGVGIGQIGGQAMTGMARQPEMAPKIQTGMLIAAALVEGIALFCAVMCFLALGKIS